MPGGERAEIYFIGAMMLLIVVLCVVAVFFFFKTYRKEMRERHERIKPSGGPVEPHETRDQGDI